MHVATRPNLALPSKNQNSNKSPCSIIKLSASSRKNGPSGELLRHTSAMVRLGAGGAKGRKVMLGVAAIGGFMDSTGIRVTPVLAATICRRVSMLVA